MIELPELECQVAFAAGSSIEIPRICLWPQSSDSSRCVPHPAQCIWRSQLCSCRKLSLHNHPLSQNQRNRLSSKQQGSQRNQNHKLRRSSKLSRSSPQRPSPPSHPRMCNRTQLPRNQTARRIKGKNATQKAKLRRMTRQHRGKRSCAMAAPPIQWFSLRLA